MPVTNKQILEEIEAFKDAFVGGVKHYIRLPLWLKIVGGVVAILFIIQVWTLFKKSKPVDDSYLKEVRQLDSTIKYQQKYIEALVQSQAMRDTIIIKELGRISGNKTTIVRLKTEYEKIPDNVNSLDRDGLRREWTNY